MAVMPPLEHRPDATRRRLLVALAALGLVPGFGGGGLAAPDLSPTPPDAEGPFFTPGSPQRASLRESGRLGTLLVVSGRVLSAANDPLGNVKLDFWHTDAGGRYDNDGFRFRGHQYSDADGRYRLETIVPGAYPGRTRHIHVKLAAATYAPLTTQLYFPGETRNRQDFLFKPALLLEILETGRETAADFDFVLARS